MIQEFIKKVGEFHDAFGVKRGNVDIELRYKLFLEEYEEYLEAYEAEKKGLEYFTTKKGEYVNTFVYKIDAIIDMLYIACGTIDIYRFKNCLGRVDRVILLSDYDINLFTIDEDMTLFKIKRHNELYNQYSHKHKGIFNIDLIIHHLIYLSDINGILNKLPELFQEVHNSNMSKLENGKPIINDGIIDPNKPIGKILKGKNYFEPNLEKILNN